MLTAIIDLHQGLFAFVAARHAPLVRPPAICQQSRHLSQRHDSTRPAFNRFIERSPRHPIITGKSDQLLDVKFRLEGSVGARFPPAAKGGRLG